MITWFQNLVLKHNKVVFGGILVIVIVAFVFTGAGGMFGGPQARTIEQRDFFGFDLNNPNAQRTLQTHAELSAALNPQLGIRGPMVIDYGYMRGAALGLAAQLGVPSPDDEQMRAFVRALPAFQDPQTGEFDNDAFTTLRDNLEANPRLSSGALNRVLREDWRIARVRDALGGPGYVLPFDARRIYDRLGSTYDVAIASWDYADFDADVEPAEETLQAFFAQDPGRYAIPERVRAQAVFFESDTFVDDVGEPDPIDLELYFERFKFRYREPTPPAIDGEAPVAPAEPVLADVRDQVVTDWKREQARRVAEERSEAFTIQVFEQEIARDSEALTAAIERFGGAVTDLAPYAREGAPANPRIPRQLFNSVWVYAKTDRFVSDPARVANGAVVLLVDEVIPARQPEFTEVRPTVLVDYRAEERRNLFTDEGRAKRDAIVAALAAGTDFTTAVADAGLTLEDPEPFTGRTVPATVNRTPVWEELQRLEPGEATAFLADANVGYIGLLESRTAPAADATEEGEDFESFFANMEAQTAQFEGLVALGEIASQRLLALEPPRNPEPEEEEDADASGE